MAQGLGECRYATHLAFDVLTPLRAAGSISTADGSALVRMGDTTVVCGVKAEIAEPDLDLPEQGFLGHSPTPSFLPGAHVNCMQCPTLTYPRSAHPSSNQALR